MLSIVIPCRNEGQNIEAVLRQIYDGVDEYRSEFALFKDFEVIVVNDGSTDDTAEVAGRFPQERYIVRVVTTSGLGYGGALITGIAHAHGDYLLVMDGDGQYPFRNLVAFAEVLRRESCDVVGGVREHRADQMLRNVNGRSWTALMRTLFKIPLRDLGCGFKLYRTELLRRAEPFRSQGAFIWTEITVKLVQLGARFAEATIIHEPRMYGTPTGNNPRVVARAIHELLRFLISGRSNRVAER